jgi:Replication initiator protein A
VSAEAFPHERAPEELHPENPDAVGYLERSLAASPVWQMGARTLEPHVIRRDPRLLDFLANAKNAPLGELEFDVLTWVITRWYQAGRPSDGRLVATLGEITYGLYGRREGGMQYGLLREALDRLFNVSLDLTVLTIENGNERWLASKRRRIIQELSIQEPLSGGKRKSSSTLEIRLGTWLVDQLDAQTVAAIAWQVLRGLSGIAKRLAIYLAAHAADFVPITQHTERFTVELTERLYEEFGITAARERDRRASIARAAARIGEQDPRYTRLLVERVDGTYVLRAERPVGADVLLLPARRP